ncbi:uncharacterized protein LOC129915072 [Episyrphus balteatus]|uniref:uncharacterized protein LOC129915072 n=1 Tax=Episyrphus balteatus TaxID=286459 RepID=UPI0024852A08|nr:uncharacterized protein LOC129915072 [Episyrphus balteatus]
MRGFIVLCLSAVALAAPQGYNYNQQISSVGSSGLGGSYPSSIGSSSSYFSGGHQQIQPQTSFGHGSPSSSYLSPHHQQPQRQEPIVSKRFFIHSAPEENDEEYREKHITVGTPRKNYNVVFIKAPAKSTKKTVVKITPAVNEDKTVIYVLNKKTDAADVHAEVLEPHTSTTKPEVYFIKYKTPEEAAHAQEQIQSQYDSLGGSSQVTDEGFAPVTSVIGSLGSNSVEQGHGGHGQQSGSYSQHAGHASSAYLPPQF